TDTNKLFGAVVVGRHLLIADGPVIAEAVKAGGLEIDIREPVGHPAPMEGLAADDSGADPHEGFARIGSIGMLGILYIEVPAELARGVLHPLFLLLPTGRSQSSIHGLVGPFVGVHVALEIDRRTSFEHDHLHAPRGQFLGGHAARRSRADYYGVVDFSALKAR